MAEPKPEEKTLIHADKDAKFQTIVHRTDAGHPYVAPLEREFIGDIHSAKNFLAIAQAKATIDAAKAVVFIDYNKGTVILEVDPSDVYAPTIKGALKKNQELAKLNINVRSKSAEMSLPDLRGLLKFAKGMFTDADFHAALMKKLETIRASFTQEMEDARQNNGNMTQNKQITTNIENGLTEPFYLTTHIFEGHDKVKFKVEICFSAEGGKLTCWFESVELAEVEKEQMDSIMAGQKQNFSDYVVIEQR